MITILLVDDRAPLREALRALLSLEPDLCVIGEAADGLTAVTMAAERDPDVVVMDVKMPHLDGIAATRALRRSVPRSRVIMVSLYDDPATRARAVEAGAAAFVGKHEVGSEALLTAIRRVARPIFPWLSCPESWS